MSFNDYLGSLSILLGYEAENFYLYIVQGRTTHQRWKSRLQPTLNSKVVLLKFRAEIKTDLNPLTST